MSTDKRVTDWATDFDFLDSEWIENPYPIWDTLRSKCPIAHTDRFMGVYLPTCEADVRAIALDTERFSSRRPVLRDGRPSVPPSPPLTSDPTEHRRQKDVLSPFFTAEAIGRYESQIRAICRELIARLSGKKNCDAASDYAQEIPTRVTAYIFGLFRKWIHDFFEVGITDQETLRKTYGEVEQALAAALVNGYAVRHRPVRTYRGGLSPARLRRVKELVHAKMEDELRLHELAQSVGLSTAHFSEMFRKSTGETPHQFVLRLRVERAKEMLRSAESRVLDVAIACGFKTQQHFARVFRHLCGLSPKEYRREFMRFETPEPSEAFLLDVPPVSGTVSSHNL